MSGMDADVIVIGAGVSGLAAAGELGRRGKDVLILEARNRVGGRLWSVSPPEWKQPVELGAEFIHGGNAALRAILRREHLRTRAVTATFWWREQGELRPIPDFWERVARVIDRIPVKNRGWSLQDFLRRRGHLFSEEDRWLVENYAGSFNAAPIGALSAQALRADHAGADDTDFKVVGRYDAVAAHLQARLPETVALRLCSPVKTVHWRRGSVIVMVNAADPPRRETYQARTVVVTLPLGVLQAGTVAFSPDLGRKQAWIEKLGWGHVARITIRFRDGFWSRSVAPAVLRARQGRGFGFVNAPGEAFPTWWALTPPEPVLTGWVGGAAAKRIAKRPLEEQLRAAVRSLAHIFETTPAAVAAEIAGWHGHDWSRDPHALGAYSYSVAGCENGPRMFAKPLARTLFFAGEATSDELGTVQGALASGLRAAREITQT